MKTAVIQQTPWEEWKQTTRFIVDSYHYINHKATDRICRTWCNPSPQDGSAPNLVGERIDKDGNTVKVREFNTEACEQLNAWLGGFESILKCMTVNKFNWFLHVMIFYHVKHVLQKMEKPNLSNPTSSKPASSIPASQNTIEEEEVDGEGSDDNEDSDDDDSDDESDDSQILRRRRSKMRRRMMKLVKVERLVERLVRVKRLMKVERMRLVKVEIMRFLKLLRIKIVEVIIVIYICTYLTRLKFVL